MNNHHLGSYMSIFFQASSQQIQVHIILRVLIGFTLVFLKTIPPKQAMSILWLCFWQPNLYSNSSPFVGDVDL